jgi:hypothetical protein
VQAAFITAVLSSAGTYLFSAHLLWTNPKLQCQVRGAVVQVRQQTLLVFASASVCSLDAILMGGMRETTVTELAGESCSGKTQVCCWMMWSYS